MVQKEEEKMELKEMEKVRDTLAFPCKGRKN